MPVDQGNQSKITHDPDKINVLPDYVYDGYGMGEGYSTMGSAATRKVWVPWSKRFEARDYFLGTTTNNGGVLSRTIPAQHPEMPWLYASSFHLVETAGVIVDHGYDINLVKGVGSLDTQKHEVIVEEKSERYPKVVDPRQTALIPYFNLFDIINDRDEIREGKIAAPVFEDGLALYSVEYTPRDTYEIRTDTEAQTKAGAVRPLIATELTRYVEREKTFSVQAIPLQKLGATRVVFTEGPRATGYVTTLPEPPPLLLPAGQIVYRWLEVPDVPWDAIRACLGRVNSIEFDGAPGYDSFDAETLLLATEPRITRGRQHNGRVLWNIEYRFQIQPNGWNNFPDIDGEFYEARIKPATVDVSVDPPVPPVNTWEKIYKTYDFNKLFVVPEPVDYQ